MSIQTFTINFPGQNNTVVPRIGHLYDPANTLAAIATAGYLDGYILSQGMSILPTDFIAAVGSDGHQWYKPVFSASGSCTLTVLP
jgi:hypothetical protein